jgi:hypothetical protein
MTTDEAAVEQWNRNEYTYTLPFQNALKDILSDTKLNRSFVKENLTDSTFIK